MQLMRPIALFFSLVYGSAVRLRNMFYERGFLPVKSLSCPVISVGNLTVGGTGKTPLIITLATMFTSMGLDVVVLSRGYRRRSSERFIISFKPDQFPGPDLVERTGDEAWLIARRVPGLTLGISPQRYETGLEAIRSLEQPIVLLDDGFQHRRLARTVNLLVIDTSRPFRTDRLIPAGRLREPLDGLHRADAIILTRASIRPDLAQEIRDWLERHWTDLPLFKAETRVAPVYGLIRREHIEAERYRDKPGLLVSAVGNPHSVLDLCKRIGVEVRHHIVFRDHHHYTRDDLNMITAEARKHQVRFVLTTEKDAVKLAPVAQHLPDDIEIYVCPIELIIQPEREFREWLIARLTRNNQGVNHSQD